MATILVVDDDDHILQLLEYALDDLAEVVTASSGEAALARTEHEVPDLVVLDVAMPGMSGLDVLRRWRAMGQTADMDVVLLSGLTEAGDQERGYRAGADAYVTKPVEIEVLHALVAAMLAAQRTAPEPSG